MGKKCPFEFPKVPLPQRKVPLLAYQDGDDFLHNSLPVEGKLINSVI